MRGAVIVGAEIAAGHDGTAVLIVTLRYDTGRTGPVMLDGEAGERLMRNCGASRISELVGHTWHGIVEESPCSI